MCGTGFGLGNKKGFDHGDELDEEKQTEILQWLSRIRHSHMGYIIVSCDDRLVK